MVVETIILASTFTNSKHVNRPHYEVTIPNKMHQFDLFLSGIDVASRYNIVRPIRMKQAKDVADMIADINNVGPLTYPKIFQCDNGSEFKADLINFGKAWSSDTTFNDKWQIHSRHLNKLLTENLFKVQEARKLNNPEKASLTWVKYLCGLVDKLNDTKTQTIGMQSKDSIEVKEVLLVN